MANRIVNKFGRNSSVGTSYVPICPGAVYQTPQAAAATTLRVKAGGNAADTVDGAGARKVMLEGLDENFAYASEEVSTAGASASTATTTTFTRLFRAYVTESGAYATTAAGSHVGNIVIENGAGGTDWATISVTGLPRSQTEIGAYTVPAGYYAYIRHINIGVEGAKATSVLGFQRSRADAAAAPYDAMRTFLEYGGLSNFSEAGSQVYGPLIGPCDVIFLAKAATGTNEVSIEFQIDLRQP